MAFSILVADLPCPGGHVTAVEVLVKLDLEPGRDVLRPGDATDVDWTDVRGSHLVLREPQDGEPVRVLERYFCPDQDGERWCEAVFDGERLVSIEPVELGPDAVDRAHAISEDVWERFAAATGRTPFDRDGQRAAFVAELRALLAGGADGPA